MAAATRRLGQIGRCYRLSTKAKPGANGIQQIVSAICCRLEVDWSYCPFRPGRHGRANDRPSLLFVPVRGKKPHGFGAIGELSAQVLGMGT